MAGARRLSLSFSRSKTLRKYVLLEINKNGLNKQKKVENRKRNVK